MQIELSTKEFRRLMDLVYIGNWIMNSTRDNDRIEDYDNVESKLLGYCVKNHMESLAELWNGVLVPSRAFEEGGIQEVIADYEDAVFFDLLAEELARRDLGYPEITEKNMNDILERKADYLTEFDKNGADRVYIDNE